MKYSDSKDLVWALAVAVMNIVNLWAAPGLILHRDLIRDRRRYA